MSVRLFFASLLSAFAFCYTEYSYDESLSECVICLVDQSNKWCTYTDSDSDEESYFCCSTDEDTDYCSSSTSGVTCSNEEANNYLYRYRSCTQDSTFCKNTNAFALANGNTEIQVTSLLANNLCVYELDVANSDFSKISKIQIETLENIYLGIDYNKTSTDNVNYGFFDTTDCSIQGNCTTDSGGNYVLYLSDVQTLFVTLIGYETVTTSKATLEIQLQPSAQNVGIYLILTVGCMVTIGITFKLSVKQMKQQVATFYKEKAENERIYLLRKTQEAYERSLRELLQERQELMDEIASSKEQISSLRNGAEEMNQQSSDVTITES